MTSLIGMPYQMKIKFNQNYLMQPIQLIHRLQIQSSNSFIFHTVPEMS